MEKILAGYGKFRKDVYPAHRALFQELATGQTPEILFITCSDSRVMPNLITQTRPGELFICRTAGNIVPAHGPSTGGVSATIDYAVMVLGVKHIIICGHSDCGAMKGVLHPEKVATLPRVAEWLHHCEAARQVVEHAYPGLDETARFRALTEENVVAQLNNLATYPSVIARMRTGELRIHGWFYDIPTGDVKYRDPESGQFRQLGEMDPGAHRMAAQIPSLEIPVRS
jgi:carbonic anhydrase